MSKVKSLEEIEAGWNAFDRPADGTLFEHYKGGRYKIVATGFLEETETPCVVYYSLERHTTWVRTAKNFFEDIEHNGQTRPRFIKIS